MISWKLLISNWKKTKFKKNDKSKTKKEKKMYLNQTNAQKNLSKIYFF